MNITIIQKYLERGHTQMECDSMHSTTKRKLKNREIYTPASYVDICKSARENHKPYDVIYVNHLFFEDYSDLCFVSSIYPCVTDIKAIRFSSDGIHVKVDFEDEWKILTRRMKKNGVVTQSTFQLKHEKFVHLQHLKLVIPQHFHSFYENLH
ncbi:hypothetical protein PR048_013563, partial [Dryococelus australis]